MTKKPVVSGRTGAYAKRITLLGKSLITMGLFCCSNTVLAQPAVKSYLVNTDLKNYSIEKTDGPNFELLMAGTAFDNGANNQNQVHFVRAAQDGTPAIWTYLQEIGQDYKDERCIDIAWDPNEPNACYITSQLRYDNGSTSQDRIKVYKVDINGGNVLDEDIILNNDASWPNIYPVHTLLHDGALYICGYAATEVTSLPSSPTYILTFWGQAARMQKQAMILRYELSLKRVTAAHLDYDYNVNTTSGIPSQSGNPPSYDYGTVDFDMAMRMTMLSDGNLHVTGACNTVLVSNPETGTGRNKKVAGVMNIVLDPSTLDVFQSKDYPMGPTRSGGLEYNYGMGIVESYDENGDNQGYYLLTNRLVPEILPDNAGYGPEPSDAGGYFPIVGGASAVYLRPNTDPNHPYAPWYFWDAVGLYHAGSITPPIPVAPARYYFLADPTLYAPNALTRAHLNNHFINAWFLNALQTRHDYASGDPYANAKFWAAGLIDDVRNGGCQYGANSPSWANINPFLSHLNLAFDDVAKEIQGIAANHNVTYTSLNGTGPDGPGFLFYRNYFRYKGNGLSNIGWAPPIALQDHSNGNGTGDIFLTAPVYDPGTSKLNFKFIHANGADGSLINDDKLVCEYNDCELPFLKSGVAYPEGVESRLITGHWQPTSYIATGPGNTQISQDVPTVLECYAGGAPFYKPASIQDNTKALRIFAELYPNPAMGHVNVRLLGDLSNASQVRIEMSNMLGQHVQTLYNGTSAGLQKETRITLPEVAPGAYMVRIYAGGNILHQQRLSITK